MIQDCSAATWVCPQLEYPQIWWFIWKKSSFSLSKWQFWGVDPISNRPICHWQAIYKPWPLLLVRLLDETWSLLDMVLTISQAASHVPRIYCGWGGRSGKWGEWQSLMVGWWSKRDYTQCIGDCHNPFIMGNPYENQSILIMSSFQWQEMRGRVRRATRATTGCRMCFRINTTWYIHILHIIDWAKTREIFKGWWSWLPFLPCSWPTKFSLRFWQRQWLVAKGDWATSHEKKYSCPTLSLSKPKSFLRHFNISESLHRWTVRIPSVEASSGSIDPNSKLFGNCMTGGKWKSRGWLLGWIARSWNTWVKIQPTFPCHVWIFGALRIKHRTRIWTSGPDSPDIDNLPFPIPLGFFFSHVLDVWLLPQMHAQRQSCPKEFKYYGRQDDW